MFGIWSLPLLWIFHEGGHYITCYLLTGRKITFKWHREFYVVPVGTWNMPLGIGDKWKRELIYFMGFGLEFLAIPFLPWIYGVCAVLHFITYFKRYDNDESRFFKDLLGV